ncbi:MAG: amino acid deaminase, partial [Comamonadaceae bacterium]
SSLMKGVPQDFDGLSRAEVAARAASVIAQDLPFPVATLRASALRANSTWFQALMRARGAELAPHGKTSMSPDLFALQAEGGCWALTLATFHQVRVARAAGWRRILLANEAVGRQELAYYIAELNADPQFDFYLYVDSVEGVERLRAAMQEHGAQRPLQVLLEVGYANGRCGVRHLDEALRVCQAVRDTQGALVLMGVSGFEGLNQYGGPADREVNARAYLRHMADIVAQVDAARFFDGAFVLLSAGGSAFYDLVLAEFAGLALGKPHRMVVRSGCYLTHDNLLYRSLQGEVEERLGLDVATSASDATGSRPGRMLQPAIEVWGQVISAPDAQTVIICAGRRDYGQDAGNPVPTRWFQPAAGRWRALPPQLRVGMVSDQHTNLTTEPGHGIAVGDLLCLGVSHPCTTFDKWQVLSVIDDDCRVVDVVRTWF